MNPAVDFEVARGNPDHPLHAIAHAVNAKNLATQAVDDALTTLRLADWGKIEKLTWDYNYEPDDQGGSYVCTSDLALTIDGERIALGYSFEDTFDTLAETLEEELDADDDEKSPLLRAYLKAKLVLGDVEEYLLHEYLLADLAGLDETRFTQFNWLAQELLDDDKTAGEVSFGVQ